MISVFEYRFDRGIPRSGPQRSGRKCLAIVSLPCCLPPLLRVGKLVALLGFGSALIGGQHAVDVAAVAELASRLLGRP